MTDYVRVELQATTGHPVTRTLVPMTQPPHEAVVWRGRVFLLARDVRGRGRVTAEGALAYQEATVWAAHGEARSSWPEPGAPIAQLGPDVEVHVDE